MIKHGFINKVVLYEVPIKTSSTKIGGSVEIFFLIVPQFFLADRSTLFKLGGKGRFKNTPII